MPHAYFGTQVSLIPLDDRPACLQFPQKMGLTGNVEVIAPPKEFLGNFIIPGKPEKIIQSLKSQDMASYNAAIISLDMLAYGGLVASRVGHVSPDEAMQRIGIIRTICVMAPHLPICAQSVIMRLAPTGDDKNEAYRGRLAEWAEISGAEDEKSKLSTANLESQIPPEALLNYQLARKRKPVCKFKSY